MTHQGSAGRDGSGDVAVLVIAPISQRQLKGCRTLPGPRAPIPDTKGEVACFVCSVKSGAASGRVCPLLCPSTPPVSQFSASPATRGTLRFRQQEGHVLDDMDHNRRHKPAGACAPASIVWIVLRRCVRDVTAVRRSCLNQGQVSSVTVISTKGWPRMIKGWQGWGEGGNPAMTPSSRSGGAQITENSRAPPLVSHAGVPCGHVLLVH